ncbi:thioredoxin family protein [Marinitoga aeolica]|uniref:Thioredoxin fold domain-containing protein n=1 Tax=Marinitoga aeolica TaxID=2809031 RepID=A0ABY8PT00_9BACT|nr:thioredoxin fold domain-containing protein [Marinitoga aeolica]WGS65764.1 thioredoxin fold domain-containing protein [Marinitoga aeolica]
MRKILILVLLVISIYSFSNVKLDDFVVHDFNNAMKIGKITGKNIIVMFSSETCYYCKKFKNEVLVDKEIQKWLRTEFIIAEINPDRNKKAIYQGKTLNYAELFGAFGVRGTPTFFFFDSKGEALAQLPGYVPKDVFLSILKFFKYFRKERISFQEFQEKNIDVNIDRKVLNLSKDDIEFLLKNDPNTKLYDNKLDEYTNIVLEKKKEELENKFYVVIYEKK